MARYIPKTRYETKNFTPTSTESSAYAWDQLADKVLGHTGGRVTSRETLDKAFALLDPDDVDLLNIILQHVPALTTSHLASAASRARSRLRLVKP